MDTKTFDKFDNNLHHRFFNPGFIERDLQILVGIIQGIKSDNFINPTEQHGVLDWMHKREQYKTREPYKEIFGILTSALEDNILTDDECENIIWFCKQYIDKNEYYQVLTAGIQRLTGILKGMTVDRHINIDELHFLDNWLEENDYLKNTYPYDEIYNLTTSVLQDKIITQDEHNALLTFCTAVTSDSNENSKKDIAISLKGGFYQIDPSITIPERTFCITGVSKKFKRREIAEKIELYGGYMSDNVSSKLNYLVVCSEKNVCWAYTCFGKKIEEAVKHRKQGAQLVIVHEFDLYDHFNVLG